MPLLCLVVMQAGSVMHELLGHATAEITAERYKVPKLA